LHICSKLQYYMSCTNSNSFGSFADKDSIYFSLPPKPRSLAEQPSPPHIHVQPRPGLFHKSDISIYAKNSFHCSIPPQDSSTHVRDGKKKLSCLLHCSRIRHVSNLSITKVLRVDELYGMTATINDD